MSPEDRGHEQKMMHIVIFTYPCLPLVTIHMPTRNAVFLLSANYLKIHLLAIFIAYFGFFTG